MEMHSSASLQEVHGIGAPSARGNFGLMAAIRTAVHSLATALEKRRRLAKEIDELRRMDDRMLADIGISRGEIDHVVEHGRRR